MEHVDLLRIYRDHFRPYVRANPDLTLGMLMLVCRRLRGTASLPRTVPSCRFQARLAERLLELAEH